jgi:hypothetical protein
MHISKLLDTIRLTKNIVCLSMKLNGTLEGCLGFV